MLKRLFNSIVTVVVLFSVILGNLFTSNHVVNAQDQINNGEPVNIELWTTPQFMGVFSPDEEGANYDSFYNEAARRFNEIHPNVNITVQVIPGADRDSQLSVALQTDTLPDIFVDSHFVLSQWAHEGVLAPLDDIISDESKEDIPEAIWDNVKIGDTIYMYPFNHNLGTLVYNADMFKEAGLEEYIAGENEYAQWTLEEYEHILNTLKENLDPSISPMGLFALNNQGDTWNLSWLRMYGHPFWSEDNQITINEEDGVKALEKLTEWKDAGLTNQGPESVSSNDINALFQNQQLAISFANTVQYNTMLGSMERGELAPFDARLALNPTENGDPLAFTYVLSSIVFNTGEEAEVEAAKEFVKFMSEDADLVRASLQGIPVRNSVSESASAEEYPFLAAQQELSEHVYNFSNNTPGYAELRNILYPELQATFTGAKTPQEALDSYAEQGNKVIESSTQQSAVLE